jgi:hypothetical protein
MILPNVCQTKKIHEFQCPFLCETETGQILMKIDLMGAGFGIGWRWEISRKLEGRMCDSVD